MGQQPLVHAIQPTTVTLTTIDTLHHNVLVVINVMVLHSILLLVPAVNINLILDNLNVDLAKHLSAILLALSAVPVPRHVTMVSSVTPLEPLEPVWREKIL